MGEEVHEEGRQEYAACSLGGFDNLLQGRCV